jgi:acyl carrier protein
MLDALPLSPNGKVDRRSLALLDTAAPVQQESFVVARTPLEEVLVGIWKEVLNVPRVSIHDNFFELGGHSLMATQVISRVRDSFQLELPVRRLFEAPTIAELAASMVQDPIEHDRIDKTADVLMRVVRLSDSEVETLLGGS